MKALLLKLIALFCRRHVKATPLPPVGDPPAPPTKGAT
jgi:hypothetical protein